MYLAFAYHLLIFITLNSLVEAINLNWGSGVKKYYYKDHSSSWSSLAECKEFYTIETKFDGGSGWGGKEVENLDFAHVAAIGWTDPVSDNIRWKCGGSLISEEFILTAAHCITSTPPDIVRLGDLDLSSTSNDSLAQQFGISEIILHPEYKKPSRYHDIALIKLDGKVTIQDNVCPACIWRNYTTNFNQNVEAAGYGQTGPFEESSPKLLFVKLSIVPKDECNPYHSIDTKRLERGLIDEQVCAIGESQDTCEGDSGGPLQVKLTDGLSWTPFIVGVVGFGPKCSTGIPGVYTRLVDYVNWIENITSVSFDPVECYKRYKNYREKISIWSDITIELHPDYEQMYARIGWPGDGNQINWNCSGAFITQDYVLTTASCLSNHVTEPRYVESTLSNTQQTDIQSFNVTKFTLHPEYLKDSFHHDVALIRLDKPAVFGPDLRFACLEKENQKEPFLVSLLPCKTVNTEPGAINECTLKQISSEKCANEIDVNEHQICHKVDKDIIPKFCELSHGGPIIVINEGSEQVYPSIYGLNQFGNDCGHGSAVVATSVLPFYDWIEQTIFGNSSVSE